MYIDTHMYIYSVNGMWLAALRASASKGKRPSYNDGAQPFGVGKTC